jgi:hypothetical protein
MTGTAAAQNSEPTVCFATLPVSEPRIPDSDFCYYATGANRHVFHDRGAFETYEATRPVAVEGLGGTTAAVGHGVVRMRGRYGDRVRTIVLTRVLHVPSARVNLISGCQLAKAGVAVTLGNGFVTLAVNGVNIVGGAIYQDLYRLDMTIVRPANTQPLFSPLA